MVWALIAVGILGLFVGVYLGAGGMAIVAANRNKQNEAERDYWQRRAIRDEQWLPTEIVMDITAEERAS